MRNCTLFAGGLMKLTALLVWLQYLNNFISSGALVAFFVTNSPLDLLRHKSQDDNPGLLERHLVFFNAMISFLSGLLLTHVCTSMISYALTCLCCLVMMCTCIRIQRRCPAATYFGGKKRHATMQQMTVGVVLVEEEYFHAQLVPYLPLLSIAVNWYLAAQLPWTSLAFLVLFLSLSLMVAFYFLFWDVYASCRLSIQCCHPRRQAAPCLSSSAIWPKSALSLSRTQRIVAFVAES